MYALMMVPKGRTSSAERGVLFVPHLEHAAGTGVDAERLEEDDDTKRYYKELFSF